MPQKAAGSVVLSDIPAGRYDEHIDQMLVGMRSFAGPVVCRWGHEANGNWYPWAAASASGEAAGTTPDHYVRAWRYIVARERGMRGESNIRWFWCPNGTDIRSSTGALYTIEDYWPGRKWVDIVGCDAFNEPLSWDSFDTILKDPYTRIAAMSGKPFWVGEVGCHEPLPGQRGTKGAWIEAMLESGSFPNMKAVCYFDFDARSAGRADWRFESSRSTFAEVGSLLSTVPGHTRQG
ncbi:MAG: glycoside hydrolase family 26 protein [Frankia sp.]